MIRYLVTGESYAGMYVPYIASGMLDEKDTTYFNVKGIQINDPSINEDPTMTEGMNLETRLSSQYTNAYIVPAIPALLKYQNGSS